MYTNIWRICIYEHSPKQKWKALQINVFVNNKLSIVIYNVHTVFEWNSERQIVDSFNLVETLQSISS